MMEPTSSKSWIHAGSLDELKEKGHRLIHGGIAVFYHEEQVHAVDNRCPHLGFPLHLGSLCDGILTCHWHHARFDLCGGGTLDPWADDVPSHDVKCEDGQIWVDPRPRHVRGAEQYRKRLREGLEQNIGIVIAKAVVGLIETGASTDEIAAIGLEYGIAYGNGWNSGLTILTAMARVLPKLDKDGQILALYHGLLHVSRNAAGKPERHLLGSLPDAAVPQRRLADWYRSCIEVRDTQGAERILLTAIDQGASDEELAAMMFAAVTDHMYLDGGHTLDFHNKAFEAMAYVAPDRRPVLLSSLVPLLSRPSRAEESHPWQAPENLVEPQLEAFGKLKGISLGANAVPADREASIYRKLLEDRPLDTIQALTDALLSGDSPVELARLVALAAAERIVRFHTQNDFRDWVAVLHTFTYANAVCAAVQRSPHPMLARAIYHGAVSLYLDRFLNVPAAKRPQADTGSSAGPVDAAALLDILDKRQQVNEAAAWIMPYLHDEGNAEALFQTLGHALLREDADFHSVQLFEAAVSQYEAWAERKDDPFAHQARETILLAAARYLAAQAPTPREVPHTARIALRLHKGETLFETK